MFNNKYIKSNGARFFEKTYKERNLFSREHNIVPLMTRNDL